MLNRRLFVGALATAILVVMSVPAVAATCLISILCPIAPPAPVAPPPSPPVTQPVDNAVNSLTGASVGSLEALLLTKVNAERALVGIPPLQVHSWAHSVARAHSERMAAAGTIWHNNDYISNGRKAMGAHALAENVGMDVSVAGAHLGLMASPSHRVNIVNKTFTHVGIGIAVKGLQIFVTQDFAAIAGSAQQIAAAKAAPATPKIPGTSVARAVTSKNGSTVSSEGPVPTVVLTDMKDAAGATEANGATALNVVSTNGIGASDAPAALGGALVSLMASVGLLIRRLVFV